MRLNIRSSKNKSASKVILLFGPTAVGKTEFISRNLSGLVEVVSADAMQVYRGLDIGTSKPSPEIRADLEHHLLDIIEYTENFSVADFFRLAEQAITDIQTRGRIPVISGGAAFYIKSWLVGLPPTPAPNPVQRLEHWRKWADVDNAFLHKELSKIDPQSGNRIPVSDRYRILRALEIFELTGKKLSDFEIPVQERQDHQILQIGLTMDRTVLYKRIEQRVKRMLKEGLREEVETLKSRGARKNDPGMRGIGYSEWFNETPENARQQIHKAIERNTRRYARRQMTFFRSFKKAQWFDVDRDFDEKRLGDIIRRFVDA